MTLFRAAARARAHRAHETTRIRITIPIPRSRMLPSSHHPLSAQRREGRKQHTLPPGIGVQTAHSSTAVRSRARRVLRQLQTERLSRAAHVPQAARSITARITERSRETAHPQTATVRRRIPERSARLKGRTARLHLSVPPARRVRVRKTALPHMQTDAARRAVSLSRKIFQRAKAKQ